MRKGETEYIHFKRCMDKMMHQKNKEQAELKKWNKVEKKHKSNKKEYLKEADEVVNENEV